MRKLEFIPRNNKGSEFSHIYVSVINPYPFILCNVEYVQIIIDESGEHVLIPFKMGILSDHIRDRVANMRIPQGLIYVLIMGIHEPESICIKRGLLSDKEISELYTLKNLLDKLGIDTSAIDARIGLQRLHDIILSGNVSGEGEQCGEFDISKGQSCDNVSKEFHVKYKGNEIILPYKRYLHFTPKWSPFQLYIKYTGRRINYEFAHARRSLMDHTNAWAFAGHIKCILDRWKKLNCDLH